MADSNNNRVVEFPASILAPATPSPSATAVFGASDLKTRGGAGQASASSFALPAGLDVDSSGKVYVAARFKTGC